MNRPPGTRQDESAERHHPTRVLIAGDDTGGRFALLEIHERRGAGPPRHLHHWEDEVVYVLAGEVTFYRNDEQVPGPPGTCILLPRGHEHAFRVESSEARLLVAVAPAGFETSYQEVTWGSDECTAERLIAVAARYGVEVTGPPPSPPSPPTILTRRDPSSARSRT